jgi:hypothetical protein
MNGATRAITTIVAILLIAPAVAAQDTKGSHQVLGGDTLWDLAARYLADPFRWPEIYDLNPQVVEDPHWIYPGELLRMPGSRVDAGERVAESPVEAQGSARGEPDSNKDGDQETRRSFGPPGEFPEGSVFLVDPSAPSYGDLSIGQVEPRPVVSMSDFFSAPVLEDRQVFVAAGTTFRLVAEIHPDITLPRAVRLNDDIVVHLNGPALEVGDYLKAVQWGRSLGTADHVLYTVAAVRVTRTFPGRDSVRAEVVRLFGDYRVGDALVLAEEYTVIPGVKAEPEEAGPVGKVIGFSVDQILLGTGELLFLDVGAADGVQVGDEFAIFSASEHAAEMALIEDRLSTVLVVHTSDGTSTARAVEIRDPGMQPGVPVRRVERMPQ